MVGGWVGGWVEGGWAGGKVGRRVGGWVGRWTGGQVGCVWGGGGGEGGAHLVDVGGVARIPWQRRSGEVLLQLDPPGLHQTPAPRARWDRNTVNLAHDALDRRAPQELREVLLRPEPCHVVPLASDSGDEGLDSELRDGDDLPGCYILKEPHRVCAPVAVAALRRVSPSARSSGAAEELLEVRPVLDLRDALTTEVVDSGDRKDYEAAVPSVDELQLLHTSRLDGPSGRSIPDVNPDEEVSLPSLKTKLKCRNASFGNFEREPPGKGNFEREPLVNLIQILHMSSVYIVRLELDPIASVNRPKLRITLAATHI